MSREKGVTFFFVIAQEIKRSLECPVIFLTQKDYADDIFNSLVDIHNALLLNASLERFQEIVNTFHIGWLEAVQDIENLKRRIKDTPRETIFQSIDYTMDCINKRHKYFTKCFNYVNKSITATEKDFIESDMKILDNLRETVKFALIEKKRHLSNTADKKDFLVIVLNEFEELLNWLDRLNDYLAIRFCTILNLTVPKLSTDLTKTLDQVIDEAACGSTFTAREATARLGTKAMELSSVDRVESPLEDPGITNIIDKIKQLEGRIVRMDKENPSAGLMALQHKRIFLEECVESYKNAKDSLSFLKKQKARTDRDEISITDDYRIFNHLLPHHERCRLVQKLVEVWQDAIGADDNFRSLISILSPTDLKEVFSDELGHYTVDKYKRKIYRIEGDHQFYQLNESNELVPVKDDEEHVYFYDQCGRYYLNENKERVYKMHDNADEYMLHKCGLLVLVNEIEDGIKYWYDDLGRYYIDEDGQHVYRDKGCTDEYHHDGLRNLIKTDDENRYYKTCPTEPMVTEESKYLKNTIGTALKRCIAEVVMAQPADPVKYLADSLEKYWNNMMARNKRLLEEPEFMAERERLKTLERVSSSVAELVPFEEDSVKDYNFIRYKSQMV